MERAGRSLSKLKLSESLAPGELACAAWPAAVGQRLATRTRASAFVRGKLIVEVEDAIWQKQLFHLRGQILHKLHDVLGNASITDLEFRIVPPRRPPQTATRLNDEADGIADAGMRMVYKQARKKATG